jgi:proteasome lid subunit RPN8/RPN11
MQLPLQQNGNPIIYRLDSRRTGVRLDDDETLNAVNVQADDEFTLLPEVTAGGMTLEDIQVGASESAAPAERPPRWRDDHEQPIAIRLQQAAFDMVQAEASATLDEVGGILIGDVVLWKGKLYVDVEAALPGERTHAGPAHITFTADTWAELLRRKEQRFPGRWIVGWFHSHPQMGIFLSDLDMTLHRHFFSQPWHVALVIDAQRHEMGLFARSIDEIRRVPHFSRGAAKRSRLRVPPWMWLSALAIVVAAAVLRKGKRA